MKDKAGTTLQLAFFEAQKTNQSYAKEGNKTAVATSVAIATQRYSTLLDATRRYSTLLDATRRYLSLLDATRRYSTLLDATRRYATLLDATRHSYSTAGRYLTLLTIN
jgi:flagellum-specific peptidoglycan hydrolase FlgJ